MKISWSTAFVLGVALSYSTAGVGQSLEEQNEMRFGLAHDSVILVSLVANNRGPFVFILDTGADISVVDPTLATRLSLITQRQTQQNTLAGVQTLQVSDIATLSAGPFQTENLDVMIQDLSEVRKMIPQVEGILGQNFLSHFNYLLDYHQHSLRLERNNEIQMALDGDPLPMETKNSRMIVATKMQADGIKNLRLILDSGANSVVLMQKASRVLGHSVQAEKVAVTSSGIAGMQMETIHSLTVGSQQFHNLVIARASLKAEEQIGDGLLPMALFHLLYVNNREGFVVLNPRRRKD